MNNVKASPDGGEGETATVDLERGDAIMGRLLSQAQESYNALGIVSMVVGKDNSFRYFAHGLTHAQVNSALSVAIHMNMNDHDKKVAADAAASAPQGGG